MPGVAEGRVILSPAEPAHGGGGAFHGDGWRQAPIQGGAVRTKLSRQFSAAPARKAASAVAATGPRGVAQAERWAAKRRTRPVRRIESWREGYAHGALYAIEEQRFRTARLAISMSDKIALSYAYIIA
jgi:hypothetical protein